MFFYLCVLVSGSAFGMEKLRNIFKKSKKNQFITFLEKEESKECVFTKENLLKLKENFYETFGKENLTFDIIQKANHNNPETIPLTREHLYLNAENKLEFDGNDISTTLHSLIIFANPLKTIFMDHLQKRILPRELTPEEENNFPIFEKRKEDVRNFVLFAKKLSTYNKLDSFSEVFLRHNKNK